MKKTWIIIGIVLVVIIAGVCIYFFVIVPNNLIKKFNALTDNQKTAFASWANTKYNLGITNDDFKNMTPAMKKAVVKYFPEFLKNATAIASQLATMGV